MEALLRHIHQLVIKHIDSSVRSSVVTAVGVPVLLFLHNRHLTRLPRPSGISVTPTSVSILQQYVLYLLHLPHTQ